MPAINLGQRLTKLKESIGPDYHHIWDCCCDHGNLGIALIQANTAPNIHLLDCVPQIIDDLNSKLQRIFSNSPVYGDQVSGSPTVWKTHCQDAASLKIEDDGLNHLIIISGIGGDLTLQIMKDILSLNHSENIDFLLCPIRQLYKLRSELNSLQLRVRKESLVEENNRIYEVIMVSSPNQKLVPREDVPVISKTGEEIWKTDKDLAKKYFSEISTHYQKRLNSGETKLRNILKEYKNAASEV